MREFLENLWEFLATILFGGLLLLGFVLEIFYPSPTILDIFIGLFE